jgi:predicted HicB family RNase H-like nuclease
MIEVNKMKNKTDKHTKKRMIHIRLDDKVHKELRIQAVQKDTTIQTIVEDLILQSLKKSKGRTG